MILVSKLRKAQAANDEEETCQSINKGYDYKTEFHRGDGRGGRSLLRTCGRCGRGV